MNSTRLWRTATAGLAAAALLTMTAGPAAAQLPDLPLPDLPIPGLPGGDEEEGEDTDEDSSTAPGAIPEAGVGGFTGYAEAAGATVFVGLPAELAGPLAPVLDALGIAGSIEVGGATREGIRIDLAQVQSDLERAAAGEDIASSSSGLVTNLLLGSEAADQPGACTGGPVDIGLPPDAETPLLTVTVAGIDCAETDERAFAQAQIVGLDIRLGALLEFGLPDAVADGVETLISTLNEQLLTPVSDGLCTVLDPILGVVLPGADVCEDGEPLLQLRNPLDLDVPVVDLDAVGATTEVTYDGDTVTATATSLFTGLNVLGVACIGGDAPPLEYTATASSDGSTAERSASAPSLALSLCENEQNLLRILLGEGPLGDIALFEEIIQEGLFDGALQAVFDGVDQLLSTLTTQAITQGNAVLGDVDGAGTAARTEPFVIASTIPLSDLPGLGDTPLGDVAVIVAGGQTAVGVNALPAAAQPPAPEDPPADPTPQDPEAPAAPPTNLPRTGMGAGLLVGLSALGAAAALRRRDG